jgi:hypothetical protein
LESINHFTDIVSLEQVQQSTLDNVDLASVTMSLSDTSLALYAPQQTNTEQAVEDLETAS